MTLKTLLRYNAENLAILRKTDPDTVEEKVLKKRLDLARGVGYLVQVQSSLIKNHELEEKLELILERLEEAKERNDAF